MYLLRAVTECHRRLITAAEALRGELDGESATPKLLRLRLEMAIAARDNLSATQQLWSLIERQIPTIRERIPGYDRLKAEERDLHIRYARHIAAWPVAAISDNFRGFAREKKQFLDDLSTHTRSLETELFEPACRMLDATVDRSARAA